LMLTEEATMYWAIALLTVDESRLGDH
jgi:hypothetical protein